MFRILSAFALLAAVIRFAPARGESGERDFSGIDNRLAIAGRLIDSGFYADALPIAEAALEDPVLAPDPVVTGPANADLFSRREAARFHRERSRLGLAASRDEFLDVAGEFVLLFQNRYRLAEPRYSVESAFWAGRAYQEAGDYERAVAMYGRAGGVFLPENMEGEAARRMSESLRLMAEELPYPGAPEDRDRRRMLLDQAIDELARARQAFPVGRRRKELELDLIALRLARREPDSVRAALAEADAFLSAEAARDDLRARAALYRGVASERLGDAAAAATWYRAVLTDENPVPDDRLEARLGLAVSLRELAENLEVAERGPLLAEAVQVFRDAIADAPRGARPDQARILMAAALLDLGSPGEAMDTLRPLATDDSSPRAAFHLAGSAALALGRLEEAVRHSLRAALPSTNDRALRLAAVALAARAARGMGDLGLALAFSREQARILRRELAFASLLAAEFAAMETLLRLGRAGGPVSLSTDAELGRGGVGGAARDASAWRADSAERLARTLGNVFSPVGDADSGFELSLAAEAALSWSGAGEEDLETALGIIRRLRNRRPPGVTESDLLSREGEAFHALALARGARVLAGDRPDPGEIDQVLGHFTLAAMNYRAAAGGVDAGTDLLDQGVVNLESGEFLLRLADRWSSGGTSLDWRAEARQRLEAALSPFNRIIRNARRVSPQVMRAHWSRAKALELLGEWREAAASYLRLANDSEAPRILRINAARRWAAARLALGGELRAEVDKIANFAAVDAETAYFAGQLAEAAGEYARAYAEYIAAADPDAPSMPPTTHGRQLLAAQRAAGLALGRPDEVSPDANPDSLRAAARELLEKTAYGDLSGPWTEGILNELVDSWLREEPDGWRTALRLAMRAAADSRAPAALRRAMLILAAEAHRKGGEYGEALERLDEARELLAGGDAGRGRADAARIVLDTARIYANQGRVEDALRAYAETFAAYPEIERYADPARIEAARLVLSRPGAGDSEVNQARSILSGLRDRALAGEILGGR
ncbi:MAG: hypothetical protein LBT97_11325 [Planctomycetota bacterium]|jgi:tetratricopeptide (TPR) repeat protein|nr:hypothetical protein [Planctomycetota bacterium]